MKLVPIKKLINSISSNQDNRNPNKFDYRKKNLVSNINFLEDSFAMCKLDILYMQRLKMPLTHDEEIYFAQQIDRLNQSIKILSWMRDNIKNNESNIWRKFLKWKI